MSAKKRLDLEYLVSADRNFIFVSSPSGLEPVKEVFDKIDTAQPIDIEDTEIFKRLGEPSLPPISIAEYQNPQFRDELFADFANVDSIDKLLIYLKKNDVPDFRWNYRSGSIEFPVIRFLAAAATMQWLANLLWEVRENNGTMQLREWAQIQYEKGGHRAVVTFQPSEEERSHYLKHWSGIKTLTGEDLEQPSFLVKSSNRKVSDKHLHEAACAYLMTTINDLVADLSPSLTSWSAQNVFSSQFRVKTGYEAIRLALFEKACGNSAVHICRNPHCPDRVYVVKPTGSRKPRSDRRYCNREGCRQWGYRHLGRVRSAKSR